MMIENTKRIRKVVVVGGGLGGLSTGAYAARSGLDTTILERRGSLGGRGATQYRAGFVMNFGAHALYNHGEAAEVLSELGVRYSGARPKGPNLVLHRDELVTLPLSIGSVLETRLFDADAKVELASAFARLPGLDPEDVRGTSARAWIASLVGRAETRAFFEALVRLSTFVGAAENFDASTALRQLQKASGGVTYVDEGWGTFVDGLAASARSAGADVQLNARVTALERRGAGGYTVRLGDRSIDAHAVVLALPREEAASLLSPLGHHVDVESAPPVRVCALDVALERLPNPDMNFVLGVDRPVYYSVHSAAARLAPKNAAMVHLVRYVEHDKEDISAARAELESLLDRLQPGWRGLALEQQFLPLIRAASALDIPSQGGSAGRPQCRIEDGLFVVGDWVRGGSWLSDASLGTARLVGEQLAAAAGTRDAA